MLIFGVFVIGLMFLFEVTAHPRNRASIIISNGDVFVLQYI